MRKKLVVKQSRCLLFYGFFFAAILISPRVRNCKAGRYRDGTAFLPNRLLLACFFLCGWEVANKYPTDSGREGLVELSRKKLGNQSCLPPSSPGETQLVKCSETFLHGRSFLFVDCWMIRLRYYFLEIGREKLLCSSAVWGLDLWPAGNLSRTRWPTVTFSSLGFLFYFFHPYSLHPPTLRRAAYTLSPPPPITFSFAWSYGWPIPRSEPWIRLVGPLFRCW